MFDRRKSCRFGTTWGSANFDKHSLVNLLAYSYMSHYFKIQIWHTTV